MNITDHAFNEMGTENRRRSYKSQVAFKDWKALILKK